MPRTRLRDSETRSRKKGTWWEHGPKSRVESGDFTKENHVTYWKINTWHHGKQDFLMSSEVDVDNIKRIKVSGYSKMFHSAIFYKQRRKKNERYQYQAGLTTKRLYWQQISIEDWLDWLRDSLNDSFYKSHWTWILAGVDTCAVLIQGLLNICSNM